MLVGRREEIQSLNEAFQGKSSEFIALFGRRRVGKTFLINEVYRDKILFSHTGIYGRTMAAVFFINNGDAFRILFLPVFCDFQRIICAAIIYNNHIKLCDFLF